MSYSGQIDKAVNVWQHIKVEWMKHDILVMNALIDGLARKGYLYLAYEYVRKYRKYHKKDVDEVTYTSLLSGCREQQNRHLAQHICHELENIATNLSENRKASISLLLSSS